MFFSRLSCSQISHLDTGLWFGLILDRAYSAILPSFRACYAQGYFGTRGDHRENSECCNSPGRSRSTRWQASKHRPLATGHSPWRELDPGLLAGHGIFFFCRDSLRLHHTAKHASKSWKVFQFLSSVPVCADFQMARLLWPGSSCGRLFAEILSRREWKAVDKTNVKEVRADVICFARTCSFSHSEFEKLPTSWSLCFSHEWFLLAPRS